jgi:hypothetical protein
MHARLSGIYQIAVTYGRIAMRHLVLCQAWPLIEHISNLDSAPGHHRIRHASINTSSSKTSNVLLNTQMSK